MKFLRERKAKIAELRARLVEVLGPQWNQLSEAQTFNFQLEGLERGCNAGKVQHFLNCLFKNQLLAEWEASVKGQKSAIAGPLLVKTGAEFVVNFDTSVASLFKEIAELRDLGYSPSFELVLLATKGSNSISLHDTLEKTIAQYDEATALRR
jgi:hypothetical protein